MQPSREPDTGLFKQLCSKLSLSWQTSCLPGTPNPILLKPKSNLISKSLAHKFYYSRKLKLSQSTQPTQTGSQHVFTSDGIVDVRRSRQPDSSRALAESKIKPMLDKYQQSPLFLITNKARMTPALDCSHGSFAVGKGSGRMLVTQPASTSRRETQAERRRTERAKSAHINRRAISEPSQKASHIRKNSENLRRTQHKEPRKEEVRGWEVEPDDEECQIRLRTLC